MHSKMYNFISKPMFWFVIGLVLFAVSRLLNLTLFPLFADEAIYIRWSQLIISEPVRYFFFALNDGKTPLQFWLQIPLLLLLENQILAARLFAALAGMVQFMVFFGITKKLKLSGLAQLVTLGVILLAPYWWFYHRLAVLESLLAVLLSITWLMAYNLVTEENISKKMLWSILLGLFFGLSLWTKIPAILFAPAIGVVVLLKIESKKIFLQNLGFLIVSGFLGLFLLATLRISPAFGQLFARGSDFLYPWQDVLFDGKWQQSLTQLPKYFSFFWQYGLGISIVLAVISPFGKQKVLSSVLWVGFLGWIAPIALFGQTVHSRYLLPAMIPLTLLAGLGAEYLHTIWSTSKAWWLKASWGLMVTLLLSWGVTQALQFGLPMLFVPDAIPFHATDRQQYLEDWSSGHGLLQTATLISNLAQNKTVAVGTEGRFGSLPDGLVLQFFNQDTQNIYIEGLEQFPVKSIPEFFINRAQDFDQVLLVVNSHRREIELEPDSKIAEFCRPNQAPCLEVWDITELTE